MFGAFCGPEYLIYILLLACIFGTIAGGGIVLGLLTARRPQAPAVAPLVPDAALAENLLADYPLSEVERLVVRRALTQPGAACAVRHHLPFGPSLALARYPGALQPNSVRRSKKPPPITTRRSCRSGWRSWPAVSRSSRVGGATEVEVKERKDRVDDGLHATRAAVEEGIVPGGGVALARASLVLAHLKPDNDDQRFGIESFVRPCRLRCCQIAENAGEDGAVISGRVLDKRHYNFGFDAQSGEFKDLVTAGIIDPTKVVRIALQHAASVAGLMITTEAMVSERSEQRRANGGPPGGGMGAWAAWAEWVTWTTDQRRCAAGRSNQATDDQSQWPPSQSGGRTTGYPNNRENDVGKKVATAGIREAKKPKADKKAQSGWRNVPPTAAGEQTAGCAGAPRSRTDTRGPKD